MKKAVRQFAHSLGFEIKRYLPSASDEAQLSKMLQMIDVNLIFDIGANEGQFVRKVRDYGYAKRIVSFEPLSSARKRLVSYVLGDSAWDVHEQSALGDQDGLIEIHISRNSSSSSVLPMLQSHSSAAVDSVFIDSEMVPVARLDTVASRYLSDQTNLFIKIDTQGYEWQVLDGARETLQQARGVMCELSLVSLYEGQKLWRDIVDRLDREGFMLWGLHKGFVDPRTGQQLQADGIFMRRDIYEWLISSLNHHPGGLHDYQG